VHADNAELSVAIRIFWNDQGIHFGTGAGITWSSVPLEEWNETVLKADRLIKIAGGAIK
jgi:para-aminobenzoate synthetase component 1